MGTPPPQRRDLVAGFILTVYSFLFVYAGAQIVQTAYDNFGDGMGVLAVQVVFEVLVVGVFLWARFLARRAAPADDPSTEAQLLIWIIFAGDVFAEVAFLNVEFASGEFFVLLAMDAFMIIMRDADLWEDMNVLLSRLCGKSVAKAFGFALAAAGGDE